MSRRASLGFRNILLPTRCLTMKAGIWFDSNEKRGTRSAGLSLWMTTTEAKGLLAKMGRALRSLWRKVDKEEKAKCLSHSKQPPGQFS